MFENLVSQEAGKLLSSDIKKNSLPGALLFSGPEASGKLSAALETARILSCHQTPQGKWLCTCPSCLQHKSLVCSNLMLMGPRDCSLEISAAAKTFTAAGMIKITTSKSDNILRANFTIICSFHFFMHRTWQVALPCPMLLIWIIC